MKAIPLHLQRLGLPLLCSALVACGSAPKVPIAPVNSPSLPPSAPATVQVPTDIPGTLSEDAGQSATVHALGLVGVPYRFGGNTPESGFDCSGLIAYVYKKAANIGTPRSVAQLKNWGQPVAAGQLRTGDLVVFYQGSAANLTATHAGIYVGEGRFVHAPSTGGLVRMDKLNAPYWGRQVVSYRRP